MQMSKSPEHFQHKMNNISQGFGLVLAHMENLFVLTKGCCTGHVQKFKLTLNKLKESGLICNNDNIYLDKPK